jgi:hypothetical protein
MRCNARQRVPDGALAYPRLKDRSGANEADDSGLRDVKPLSDFLAGQQGCFGLHTLLGWPLVRDLTSATLAPGLS